MHRARLCTARLCALCYAHTSCGLVVWQVPRFEEFPDGPCLLGGEICHPTSQQKYTIAWRKEEGKDIQSKFQMGANVIDYDRFMWCRCWAIYWPSCKGLHEILKKVVALERYNDFALSLARTQLVRYLWWPPIFGGDDDGVSRNAGYHGRCETYLRGQLARPIAAARPAQVVVL